MNAVFARAFYTCFIVFGCSLQTHLWAADPAVFAEKMHTRAQQESTAGASALKIIHDTRRYHRATARKRSLEITTDLLIMAPLLDTDTDQSIQEFSVEPASTKACVLVLKKSCLPAHTHCHPASPLTLHRIIVLINDSETPTPAWLTSIAETVVDVSNLVEEPDQIIKKMIEDLLNKSKDKESSDDDRDDDDSDFEEEPHRSNKKSAKKCCTPAATATKASSDTLYKKVYVSLSRMLQQLGRGFNLFVSNTTAPKFSDELDKEIANRETMQKTRCVTTPLLVTSLNNYEETLVRVNKLNKQQWIIIFVSDNQEPLDKLNSEEAQCAVIAKLCTFNRFVLAMRREDSTYRGVFIDPLTKECMEAKTEETTAPDGIAYASFQALTKLIKQKGPPTAPDTFVPRGTQGPPTAPDICVPRGTQGPPPPTPLKLPQLADEENTDAEPLTPFYEILGKTPPSPLAPADPRLSPPFTGSGISFDSTDKVPSTESRRLASPPAIMARKVALPIEISSGREAEETPESFAEKLHPRLREKYYHKVRISSTPDDLSLVRHTISATYDTASKNTEIVFFLILRARDCETIINTGDTQSIESLFTLRNVYFVFIDQILKEMVPTVKRAPRCIFSMSKKRCPDFSGYIHNNEKLLHHSRHPDADTPLRLETIVLQFIEKLFSIATT